LKDDAGGLGRQPVLDEISDLSLYKAPSPSSEPRALGGHLTTGVGGKPSADLPPPVAGSEERWATNAATHGHAASSLRSSATSRFRIAELKLFP
jgi:hypothetical protein